MTQKAAARPTSVFVPPVTALVCKPAGQAENLSTLGSNDRFRASVKMNGRNGEKSRVAGHGRLCEFDVKPVNSQSRKHRFGL